MNYFCNQCNKRIVDTQDIRHLNNYLCHECASHYKKCTQCGQTFIAMANCGNETSEICIQCRETSILFGPILEKKRKEYTLHQKKKDDSFEPPHNNKLPYDSCIKQMIIKDKNFPQIRGTIFLFFLVIAFHFLVSSLLSQTLSLFEVYVPKGDPTHLSVTILLSYILVLYIGSWKNGTSFIELFPIDNVRPLSLIVITFTSLGIYSLSFFYHFFLNNYAYLDRIELDYFKALIYPNIYSFGLLVLVAPITEEFFFRGLLLNGLTRKYSVKHSLAVSSFFFALMHFSVQKFIPVFLLGFLFGLLFLKSKNLLPSILIHSLNNGIAFFHVINFDDIVLVESSYRALILMIGGLFFFCAGIYTLFRLIKLNRL